MQLLRAHHARRSAATRHGVGARLALAALAMVGVAACASASHTATLRLNAYLVHPGEQTGYQPVSSPSYLMTPAQFDAADPDAATANQQLARAGFRRGISLHTVRTSGGQGVSTVIELGSPKTARQEQAAFVGQARALMSSHGPAPLRFTVPGVPDVVGLADKIAANVIYVEGRCLVIVGDETRSVSPRTPAASGARAIYTRTHADAGACSSS